MEYNITRMIMLLSRKCQICIGSVVDKYNLTAAEEPFFMALYKHEGITQEVLTEMVGVDKAATARTVKSLEEKGFLIRKRDEKDRRRNQLYVTEKAKDIYPSVKKDLLALNARITEGIEEREQEKIYAILQTLEQNFISIKKRSIRKRDTGRGRY